MTGDALPNRATVLNINQQINAAAICAGSFRSVGASALYTFPYGFLCIVCAEGFQTGKAFLSRGAAGHIFSRLDSYDPYKAAYGSMPPHAAANPAIQQMYINGHFCYAFKFGIITNGLGIVRDITFYNKEFAGWKTQNEKTLHADLLLAGITQLITVIVADKIHKHEYLRSLKPLVA